MSFPERLGHIRKIAAGFYRKLPPPHPAVILFFSVSDGPARAHVVHASGPSFEATWQKLLIKLRTTMRRHRLKGTWLRLDWAEAAEAMSLGGLRARLAKTKRNYFREGLALDPQFETAFLEQELNANAMLYGGNAIEHAIINQNNVLAYARRRYGPGFKLDMADERDVYAFSSRGIFCDEDGRIHMLNDPGPDTGRRQIPELDDADVLALIAKGSQFLANQVGGDGSFIYGYHPCFDRQIGTYNTLRHASTTYAMLEAWQVTGDRALKAAIDRSLRCLTEKLIRSVTLADGSRAAFLVDVGNEIKLGGNAVAILALCKYSEITGTETFLPLLERLALGIRFMQSAETGAFVHVLNTSDLSTKDAFRTIYYEGEAAFGLMRLYSLTRDPRWLAMVEKAFEHFIAKEHWKHHDHWLGYCVNELTRYRPQERYFRFGIQNIADHLDFVVERITTFPTLLELMMAAQQMLARIGDMPEYRHLLGAVDLEKFERALEFRAHHLLNGFFWPEMAMYFRNPERIAGSFFIRHHAFRVRIDDVEHYLSGFVAYRSYLQARPGFRQLVSAQARPAAAPTEALAPPRPERAGATGPAWTAAQVEEATGGSWLTPPPADWTASGLCTYAPAMQPGNLVATRPPGGSRGVPLQTLGSMRSQPAGIIAPDTGRIEAPGTPVLRVADVGEAILAMGHYARARMSGKILAVTGSAGKTTAVAMLAHALSAWGPVSRSAHSANLPHGVAWNLASIAWDTPHVVLELAIGKMIRSAQLARPHVAVFTNILPAHLGPTSTIIDVARAKSGIFRGMSQDGTAVLNRDMLEWETVREAARARGIKVLHYGTAPDCEFRLLDYAAGGRKVRARIMGQEVSYHIGATGLHMAMNSLAALAAVSALGHGWEPALAALEGFAALPGRGHTFALTMDDRRLTVIDDAYNANPGSMRAALERLGQEDAARRRVAVLGQMAELGPAAESYHNELAALVERRAIDRVYVTGELYAGFWKRLPASRRGRYADSVDDLKAILRDELADGDTVLFKGSNSTCIHQLVAWMRDTTGSPSAQALGSVSADAAHRPRH